ncbi:signal peptidase I [Lujinxingia litoralis]|uniref:Signal peptidase I n=2 Tax=Lujinxingia litoralis TaxID=2211119 RepID=A0A328C817_9DELT|nr:signal peptidase I [Lujinxingia litoralis]
MIAFGLIFLVSMLVSLVMIAAVWKIYTKAGEPGWASIVPVYNSIVLAKIAGKEPWWGLLLYVPFINLVAMVILCIGLAHAFGKDTLWGLGLIFFGFIFFPLLGFGSATYQGERAATPSPSF